MKTDLSIRETIREDGLRIITKDVTTDRKTSVSITARNGSADDPPGLDGLHHFFEHMGFKGTKRRALTTLKSNLERYMLNFNASTHNIRTTYEFQCHFKRINEATEILLDLYTNSTYPENEIEIEKNVVNTEIETKAENDNLNCYYGMMNLLWQNNPLKHRGTGKTQDIAKINRDILLNHRDIIHEPSNTVIIACGKMAHDFFVCHINNLFPISKSYRAPKRLFLHDETGILPSDQLLKIGGTSKTMAEMYSGIKVDKNLFIDLKSDSAMSILIRMLGTGMNSILWNEIREKRGLVYSISMNQLGSTHLGKVIYVYAKAIQDNIDQVYDLVQKLLFNADLHKSHFMNAKELCIDAWELSMDDSSLWRSLLEYDMIWQTSTIEEFSHYKSKLRKALRDVRFEDVLRLYAEIFTPEKLATCIITPNP